MINRINIESVEPKLSNGISYVNITEALKGNEELQKYAMAYFRGMTAPVIQGEEGSCVYSHDWNNFVKYVMWKISNNNTNISQPESI